MTRRRRGVGSAELVSPRAVGEATRYVLLCHARTGSNLVQNAMIEHPEIAGLGEILTPEETTRELIARLGPLENALYVRGQDGAEFLDTRVFVRNPPAPMRTCGFKMFYDYARWDREMKSAWGYLTANTDIRVIHLTRRNLLRCLISLKVAKTTGQWFCVNEPGSAPKRAGTLWLDPEECHCYFDRIMSWRSWVCDAMEEHPMLELEYEKDVCGDFGATMARVFGFLEVSQRAAEPSLVKQRLRTPREQVENLEELRRHFRYTMYEEFFEEGGE